MGMSALERRQMRSALGLIAGEPCTVGAFYDLPAAWMREILQENEHLNKEMHKFYERAGELAKRVRELEAALARTDPDEGSAESTSPRTEGSGPG